MAKDSDHRAGGFETDNTGGVLSGLLAEEDEFDRRALWRIGSWGVGTVAAVILAVMANQTQFGLKREQMAATDLTRQAQQIQLAARETQNEARRLASAVDTLNGDRDRLYARVTTLEQGLDSVTGAFIRQVFPTAAPAPATPSAIAEPAPAPAIAPVGTAQPALPEKPAAGATAAGASPATGSSVAKDVAKTEAAKTDAAKTDAAKTDLTKTEMTKPETVKAETGKSDGAKADSAKADSQKTESQKADSSKNPAATPATPLVAAKSIMAPPDPAAAKLIEPDKPLSAVTASPIPEVVTSAPAATDEEADEATAPKVALQRTEFGVDLGSANSVSGLRALWLGLLKSRSNAPLTALRPIIVVKERSNGLGMQLRLVAGPLNDAGAAAKICAVMTENKRACETAIFDGQRLQVKSDDVKSDDPPPASTRPALRRRSMPKHTAALVAEAPPKRPDAPSTISSWFGKKEQ